MLGALFGALGKELLELLPKGLREEDAEGGEADQKGGEHDVHRGVERLGKRRHEVEEDDCLRGEGVVVVLELGVRHDHGVGARDAKRDAEREEELAAGAALKPDWHADDEQLAEAPAKGEAGRRRGGRVDASEAG